MTKESGLGDRFFIDGYDLSGDVAALDSIVASRNALDVTSIDQSAVQRLPGLRDGSMDFTTWYDSVAGQEHTALNSLAVTDFIAAYFHGTTLGNPTASCIGKKSEYSPSRGADGSLSVKSHILANGFGVEWGQALTTGKQTFASSGSGASIDFGSASTAFGATGYLQVLSVASGTATVAIQDSADNSSFANISGLAFTGATARTTQKLSTGLTATIRRYVRVNLTGAFTNAVVAVTFVRYLAAQG